MRLRRSVQTGGGEGQDRRALHRITLPDLPPNVAGCAHVTAIIDRSSGGDRAIAWASGYVRRTPNAVLVIVVVDIQSLNRLCAVDPWQGPVQLAYLDEQGALAVRARELSDEARRSGVTAFTAISEQPLYEVFGEVLGMKPDLVVVGFHNPRVWRPLLGKVTRHGVPLVVIS
jgi:hypothetical protein